MLRAMAAMLLVASVAACVIMPVPVAQKAGPEKSSRGNLAESTAANVGVGSATRRDVLLALGEPDGRGADDEWFTYGELAHRGGVKWGLFLGSPGGAGATTFKDLDVSSRLTIRFDEDGVVSDASFEHHDCTKGGAFVDPSNTCLSAAGVDLAKADEQRRETALIAAASGAILARHGAYMTERVDGPDCTFKTAMHRPHGDAVAVTEQSLIWQGGEHRWESLRWEDVRDVGALEHHAVGMGEPWIPLFAKDGSCYFFALYSTKPHEVEDLRSEIVAAFTAYKRSGP